MKRKGWGEGCEVWGAPLGIRSSPNTRNCFLNVLQCDPLRLFRFGEDHQETRDATTACRDAFRAR